MKSIKHSHSEESGGIEVFKRLATMIGWTIAVAMGCAIVLGGSKSIGIVSAVSTAALGCYMGVLYWRHPEVLRHKRSS